MADRLMVDCLATLSYIVCIEDHAGEPIATEVVRKLRLVRVQARVEVVYVGVYKIPCEAMRARDNTNEPIF
jgi:hypothetical protein